MVLAQAIARQLARPHGTAGRWLGRAMDIANRKPTRLAVDLLAARDGERVLDAGCGTGAAMAQVLRRARCQITGIDPSEAMIDRCRRRFSRAVRHGEARFHICSAEDMACRDERFDAVLALNVLYFCQPDGSMALNLARALRPGGRLVAYVTHRDTMANWPFVQAGLHRLYDRESLVALLEAAGFARQRIAVQEVPITRNVRGLLAFAER